MFDIRLIVTRHGETIDNINGVLQGHRQGKLSSQGVKQAKAVAKRLKDEKIDCIYSSDLARTADTAKEIAKYHPKAPIYFVKELRETDTGSFTGKKSKDIDWNNRPADMESRDSLRKRSKKILDIAYKRYPDGTVLFAGHNGINRALISIILDKPEEFMDKIKRPENTSISIFDIKENNKNKMILENCIKHLE